MGSLSGAGCEDDRMIAAAYELAPEIARLLREALKPSEPLGN
jgi:hypothetical protein